jgi:hypothetical protein
MELVQQESMTIKIPTIALDSISHDVMSKRRKIEKKNKKNIFFSELRMNHTIGTEPFMA